jgi:hypothetical protein
MNEFQFLLKLKDADLLEATRTRVAEEKNATLAVLYHLREVERRRLHLARGFQSLYDFATRELGYSPAAAQRRIDAMRLLREFPELVEKIQSGRIGLDSAARAQSFFKQESKVDRLFTVQEKREVLAQLEGKSSRECERHLASLSSRPEAFLRPDSVRPVSAQAVELRFVAGSELMDKLDRIREQLSHQKPAMGLAELLEAMAGITLEVLSSKGKGSGKSGRVGKGSGELSGKDSVPQTEFPAPEVEAVRPLKTQGSDQSPEPSPKQLPDQSAVETGSRQKRSRYIPAKVQRAVYERDSRRCSYHDPLTGRVCGSRFQLELDHLRPFGRGGENSVENLALRCRPHNQFAAIRAYGELKISRSIRVARSYSKR